MTWSWTKVHLMIYGVLLSDQTFGYPEYVHAIPIYTFTPITIIINTMKYIVTIVCCVIDLVLKWYPRIIVQNVTNAPNCNLVIFCRPIMSMITNKMEITKIVIHDNNLQFLHMDTNFAVWLSSLRLFKTCFVGKCWFTIVQDFKRVKVVKMFLASRE